MATRRGSIISTEDWISKSSFEKRKQEYLRRSANDLEQIVQTLHGIQIFSLKAILNASSLII